MNPFTALTCLVIVSMLTSACHYSKSIGTKSAYGGQEPQTKLPSASTDHQSRRVPFRTVAHEVLALEGEVLPIRPEMKALLDEVISAAVSAYNHSQPQFSKLPTREHAIRTLELIESVLQGFHFVYPAVGYVGTLRDGLEPVNVDTQHFEQISNVYENQKRRNMILNSPSAVFHIADCDIFSILYVAIGEALKLPITMVDLPSPPGGVGHNYVTWTLSDGTRVNWEAMSGTERLSSERDQWFFSGSPRTMDQAISTRAFAVPMSHDETLAYWHLIVGGAVGAGRRE